MKHTSYDEKFITDDSNSFIKEYLLTSGNGSYCSSTLAGCNTRKYHGLLVAPQPHIDTNDHVFLAALDEVIIYKQRSWELATHKYPNHIHPQGYKNISGFTGNPIPTWLYKLDDCVVEKEILMPANESSVLIRYTVAEAFDKVQLTLQPFVAFRNAHSLTGANSFINKKIGDAGNGIKLKLYDNYPELFIQLSQKAEFIVAPDWYYRIEYPQEQRRGYPYSEDLFVPGRFSVNLKKGDKLVVYAGLDEISSKSIATKFNAQLKKKPALNTETDCLLHAAKQFVIRRDNDVRIKAGYHWFGCWGRDTFISLPGLLLATGNDKEFIEVINSSIGDLKNGLMPNVGTGSDASYNSVDASLWFIWALQQYSFFKGNKKKIWKDYGRHLLDILSHYKTGTDNNIKMDDDGLIFAGGKNMALTWMDAIVNGIPITPRAGKAVEINALWYNAICFCLDLAKAAGDDEFISNWEKLPEIIRSSFITTFWNDEKQYLADCVNGSEQDWSVRPNQVFAISLHYSPVPVEKRNKILDLVRHELLTSKGLRTLSPADNNYKGKCEGNQETRDAAYHQGTVWPWLLGHYAEALLKTFPDLNILSAKDLGLNIGAMLEDACLYSVPEIYNGDEPHKSVGAAAQAWSVAELIRLGYLLEEHAKNRNKLEMGVA